MEKMAIKNRESCRLDWSGIPGSSIQQLLRNQKYVEFTTKLNPRFRREFLVLFITTINEKISGRLSPIVTILPIPEVHLYGKMFSRSRGFPIPEFSLYCNIKFLLKISLVHCADSDV